jgi:hypothetical protein
MKVTIRTSRGSMSLEVDRSFQLLVDDEMLLEHNGPLQEADYNTGYVPVKALYAAEPAKKCCYGTCHGTSSLFEHAEEEADGDVTYINFSVPNSSFIETIRWWSYEDALGENALEVHFKDGNYACYSDVPEGVVLDWINEIKDGQSAGKYFNWKIKDEYESIMES